jgi:hypothetical protein
MDIQLKRGTAADLALVNPTLAAGELCLESDTRKFKFGDGVTAWNALAYASAASNQLFSTGGIAALTVGQQADIEKGSLVTTTDGRRWVYTGAGDKTLEASYVEIADVTPEWDAIANKPTEFTPAAHTHTSVNNSFDVNGAFSVIDATVSALTVNSGSAAFYSNLLTVYGYLNGIGIGGTPSSRLHIFGSGATSASTALTVVNSSLAPLLTVRDDGYVGVGTAAPTAPLDVVGDLKVSGTITPGTSYDLVGGTNISVVADGTTGTITVSAFPAGSSGQVQYNSSGVLAGSSNFTFDGSALNVTGQINIDNLRFDGNTINPTNSNGSVFVNWAGTGNIEIGDAAMAVSGQRSIGVSLDATARTLAQNNVMAVMGGRLGVNTLTPVDVLDVNGYAYFRNTTSTFGRAYFASPQGDTYAYITTDTSGHLTFQSGSATIQCRGQNGDIVLRSSSQSVDIGSVWSNTVASNFVRFTLGSSGTERARVTMQGLHVTGAGQFANRGDARAVIYNYRGATASSTPAEIFLGPTVANERLTLVAQTVLQFEAKVVAYDSTNNKAAAWTLRGAIRRDNSNNTALMGTVTSERWYDTGMDNAAVALTADDTNEALIITVTGLSNATLRWHAAVVTSEVSFGTPA